MAKKSAKSHEITLRSSAAEYLTFVSAIGDQPESVELRYQDENIWLTQRLMAELYGVDVRTISEHIQKIYADHELEEEATIRNFRIVQTEMADWETRLNGFLTLWDREVLQDAGRITAELAKAKAETEFEKYRIVQDRLYQSDFDHFLQLEIEVEDKE